MHNLLTVVLTLKGRHAFTLRWLEWASSQQCPFKILIADGSEDETAKSYLTEKNIKYLNIEYIRYKYDETLRDWFFKIKDVLHRVNTKYVIQTDNDDFLLFSRLLEILHLLEHSEKDIFYIVPQYRIGFDVGENRGKDQMLYPQRKILVQKTKLDSRELDNANAKKRLELGVRGFQFAHIWYGVHLTETLRPIHDFVYDSGMKIALFEELYIVYGTIAKSRIANSNMSPYLVRQEFTSQAASSLYETEAPDKIFLLRSWSDDLHALVSQLRGDLFSEGVSVSPDEFDGLFKENFYAFLLKKNRFAYLSNRARYSYFWKALKKFYERCYYLRSHRNINKYESDKEFIKLKDFLFLRGKSILNTSK